MPRVIIAYYFQRDYIVPHAMALFSDAQLVVQLTMERYHEERRGTRPVKFATQTKVVAQVLHMISPLLQGYVRSRRVRCLIAVRQQAEFKAVTDFGGGRILHSTEK